eukprot:scaffold85888_cov17-Tisochrysis_lutea.AAC.1
MSQTLNRHSFPRGKPETELLGIWGVVALHTPVITSGELGSSRAPEHIIIIFTLGRYLNHLDSKVNKSPLTPEEDAMIVK